MAEYDESREAAQQAVFDAILANALNIERSNNGITADMNAVMDAAAKKLAAELIERLENLTPGELTALSRYQVGQRIDKLPTRVQGVIKFIEGWADSLDTAIASTWADDAKQFAQTQVNFVATLMDKVIEDLPALTLTGAQVYKQAMQSPMLGTFVEQSLATVAPNTKERVYSTIRQGITQGQTNSEIVRALRGTPGANYKDGILNRSKNDLERITRSARNHVGNTAYLETYQALGVEQLVHVSVIDGRVTMLCASLDGHVYVIGKDTVRQPPLHWGCRSILCPYFGGEISGTRPYVKAFKPIQRIPKSKRDDGMVGQVKASTSVEEFLRRPANVAFAKQYFGERRYQLFKSGKLSVKQMIRTDGTKLSLDELEAKYSDIWAQVFGETA